MEEEEEEAAVAFSPGPSGGNGVALDDPEWPTADRDDMVCPPTCCALDMKAEYCGDELSQRGATTCAYCETRFGRRSSMPADSRWN